MKPKKIDFDLDGILTDGTPEDEDIQWWDSTPLRYVKYYQQAKPNQSNIQVLNLLKHRGHIITVYTARSESYREVTEQWLGEHQVNYDTLIMDKHHYDFLIDDHAYNSVEEVLEKLLEE